MFEIKENISLKNYNTFGIDVNSKFFVECNSTQDIIEFLKSYQNSDLPLMILGGGSNVLFTQDFDGYILHPSIKGIEIQNETKTDVTLKVGAGEDWDEFVAYCVEHGWGGIENLSLIPGNVGTCPIQNIGAYGVEVKDVIAEVETMDIKTFKSLKFKNQECNFGYRDSIFKRELKGTFVITHVSFKLQKQPVFKLNYGKLNEELKRFGEVNLANIRQAVIDIRDLKLPKPEELGNAGSFFKNPVVEKSKVIELKSQYENMPSYDQGIGKVKIPAGWLIEKAGWKGRTIGNAGVHKNQALVIVNYGGAAGSDIYNLATEIQKSVQTMFDIDIAMEVNIV